MNTETKKHGSLTEPTIVGIILPGSSHGFRAGYAYATVDGIQKKIYTSESDLLPWNAHLLIVRSKFAAGQGHAI